MKIRIGIEGGRRPVLNAARELGAPILVSANSLWDNKRQKFGGFESYRSHDVALDSGGFVAMKKYGGYRWTVEAYVALAKALKPSWWAQMDFCCEPEIAASHSEIVARIDRTANHLVACREAAEASGTPQPMPVLQGWNAEDYCNGPIFETGNWPDLVGVGSVCRRAVHGKDGVLAVVAAIDSAIPKHVKLHLFGVKSSALEKLHENFPDRIASVDSMAWNQESRWDAFRTGESRTNEHRARFAASWFTRQTSRLSSQIQTQFQFA